MAQCKVLVVEDDMEMLKATAECLRSVGHEVIPATDALNATKIAVSDQPDVIVLDINLPAGDGHTVAERLRNNVKTMSIPIIYLTSKNSNKDISKAKQLGAFGYLVKPLRPESLLNLVNDAIRAEYTKS